MKESAVSEKKTASAQSKAGASAPTRDEQWAVDQPLMSIVQRSCSGCGPSVLSMAGGMMQIPMAQRQAAAMSLQRAKGNRFVQGMAVQAKLLVGPADDEYEKEADRVADQVMSIVEPRVQQTCLSCNEEDAVQRTPLVAQITPLVQRQAAPEEEEEIQTKPLVAQIAPLVQRQAAPEEEEEIQTKPLVAQITPRVQAAPEEEEEIQTKPLVAQITPRVQAAPEEEEEIQTKPLVPSAGAKGGLAETDLEQSLAQARGNGSPLAEDVRGRMENAFGVDFSTVRIHSDEQADILSRSIQARAFTTGKDIFLRRGEYRPESSYGQRLLAHELTHVVQQNRGARVQTHKTHTQRMKGGSGGIYVPPAIRRRRAVENAMRLEPHPAAHGGGILVFHPPTPQEPWEYTRTVEYIITVQGQENAVVRGHIHYNNTLGNVGPGNMWIEGIRDYDFRTPAWVVADFGGVPNLQARTIAVNGYNAVHRTAQAVL